MGLSHISSAVGLRWMQRYEVTSHQIWVEVIQKRKETENDKSNSVLSEEGKG